MQRATKNEFNVIVAAGGRTATVDVSVKFKPVAGGGRVGRHRVPIRRGKYYVCARTRSRDNFRLYPTTEADASSRRHGESACPRPVAYRSRRGRRRPHAGVARRQAVPGSSDQRFKSGRVGLWTKPIRLPL